MRGNVFRQLASEEDGFILSSESLLIASITVLGLLVGIVSVRDSVVQELKDYATAVGLLNQSYEYSGVTNSGGTASSDGGLFEDDADVGDGSAVAFFGEDPEDT